MRCSVTSVWQSLFWFLNSKKIKVGHFFKFLFHLFKRINLKFLKVYNNNIKHKNTYAIEFCSLAHLVSPSSVFRLVSWVSFRTKACLKVLISSSNYQNEFIAKTFFKYSAENNDKNLLFLLLLWSVKNRARKGVLN